mmetsp:Transcript_43980/g.113654  ORF Transcript_43980/g.113654 Transcript_43980/m.113654 type:complete len:209 (+) Transcript_43980:497-1123(+)
MSHDLFAPQVKAAGHKLRVRDCAVGVCVKLLDHNLRVGLWHAHLLEGLAQLVHVQGAAAIGVVALEDCRERGQLRHIQLRRQAGEHTMVQVAAALQLHQPLRDLALLPEHRLANRTIPPWALRMQAAAQPRLALLLGLGRRRALLGVLLQEQLAQLPAAVALHRSQQRWLLFQDHPRQQQDVVGREGQLPLRQQLIEDDAQAPEISLG